MHENGIATAEDFRAAKEAARCGELHLIGQAKPFKIRRPSTVWFYGHRSDLDLIRTPPETPEGIEEYWRIAAELVSQVVVEPKIEDVTEFDYGDILMIREFVISGATEEARRTAEFFRQRRGETEPGANGENVELPAEHPAGD